MPRRVARARPSTKVWIEIQPVAAATVVNASSVALIGVMNATALALRPFTILRTRLLFHAESDQGAASELPFGSFGLIVVTESAAAAGIGSLPTPNTEADASWFVWQAWLSSFVLASAVGFNEPSGSDYDIDSKAMRKVGIDDQVAVIAENVSGVGSQVVVNGRMLVQLH